MPGDAFGALAAGRRRAAKAMEWAMGVVLPGLFRRSFFQASLYRCLTQILAPTGPRLFVDPLECIGASILVSQAYYEQASIDAVKRKLVQQQADRLLFVDVGANLGNHLVAFSDVYDQGLGIEPIACNYYLCRANILYNQLGEKASVHQLALSDHAGTMVLQLPGNSSYLSGQQRNNGMFRQVASWEEVGPRRALALQRRQEVAVERADVFLLPYVEGYSHIVIKIDCEGGEPDVMRGLMTLLVDQCSKDFTLLVEVLDRQALLLLAKIAGEIDAQSNRRHKLLFLDAGANFKDTQCLDKIMLPQSMLMIRFAPYSGSQEVNQSPSQPSG